MHCLIQNIETVGLMVLERMIFKCLLYKSVEANDPRGEVNLYSKGKVGRLYVWDYLKLLYTVYSILNIQAVGLMISKTICTVESLSLLYFLIES